MKEINQEGKAKDGVEYKYHLTLSFPSHWCKDEGYEFEITPFVIAKRCQICKRLLSARERSFWRRLQGLFWDNV